MAVVVQPSTVVPIVSGASANPCNFYRRDHFNNPRERASMSDNDRTTLGVRFVFVCCVHCVAATWLEFVLPMVCY